MLEVAYPVVGGDFTLAGEGASKLKRVLQQVGLDSALVRRIAVAAYEAELNIVIHAYRGTLRARVMPESVEVCAEDEGPGIPDVPRAMQDGFSTAPEHVRELGFGAGAGLPNMERNADSMEIHTVVGQGTTIRMLFGSSTAAGPAASPSR